MTRTLTLIALCAGATFATGAIAKLPQPTEAQQAKAAETRARAAWADKVAAYQLCRAQDKTVAYYKAAHKSHGQEAGAPAPTGACADPGPYVAPTAAPAAAAAPAVASTGADGKPVAAGAVQSPAKAP